MDRMGGSSDGTAAALPATEEYPDRRFAEGLGDRGDDTPQRTVRQLRRSSMSGVLPAFFLVAFFLRRSSLIERTASGYRARVETILVFLPLGHSETPAEPVATANRV